MTLEQADDLIAFTGAIYDLVRMAVFFQLMMFGAFCMRTLAGRHLRFER